MRLNLNSAEESDVKEECIDGVKVISYIICDTIQNKEPYKTE